MLEEKNTFELEALQVNTAEGTTFEIKDFDNIKETAKSICDSYIDVVIANDDMKKKAKDFRARCNKARDQIKSLRLSTMKEIMGTFEAQCKELEKIFDTKQNKIGEMLNCYEEAQKAEKTLVNKVATYTYKFKLTFTDVADSEILDNLINFCKKNDITLEEI